jgi:hypothetical protein
MSAFRAIILPAGGDLVRIRLALGIQGPGDVAVDEPCDVLLALDRNSAAVVSGADITFQVDDRAADAQLVLWLSPIGFIKAGLAAPNAAATDHYYIVILERLMFTRTGGCERLRNGAYSSPASFDSQHSLALFFATVVTWPQGPAPLRKVRRGAASRRRPVTKTHGRQDTAAWACRA